MSDSGTPGRPTGQQVRPSGAQPNRATEDMAGGEEAKMRDVDAELAVQLSEQLAGVRDRILTAFPGLDTLGFRGELTVLAPADRLVDLLMFCRDDPDLRCELLSDLSCVHWPGGRRVENAQETTGWPSYESGEEQGRLDVGYILTSLSRGHRFRVTVRIPDDSPRMPSVVALYDSANFMECEVYDFFGVVFDGHPDLRRLHMPEDWNGHPLRKDYPLGGVDVQYKGAVVPPPDDRQY